MYDLFPLATLDLFIWETHSWGKLAKMNTGLKGTHPGGRIGKKGKRVAEREDSPVAKRMGKLWKKRPGNTRRGNARRKS